MAAEHEIEDLIRTAMSSLREMMDVNTIVGEAISDSAGVTVIPVSKVSCGFLAGGGDQSGKRGDQPFWGGSGAGLQVQPVCFLVMNGDSVHLIPICGATPMDRMVDSLPALADRICQFFADGGEKG